MNRDQTAFGRRGNKQLPTGPKPASSNDSNRVAQTAQAPRGGAPRDPRGRDIRALFRRFCERRELYCLAGDRPRPTDRRRRGRARRPPTTAPTTGGRAAGEGARGRAKPRKIASFRARRSRGKVLAAGTVIAVRGGARRNHFACRELRSRFGPGDGHAGARPSRRTGGIRQAPNPCGRLPDPGTLTPCDSPADSSIRRSAPPACWSSGWVSGRFGRWRSRPRRRPKQRTRARPAGRTRPARKATWRIRSPGGGAMTVRPANWSPRRRQATPSEWKSCSPPGSGRMRGTPTATGRSTRPPPTTLPRRRFRGRR